MTEDTIGIMIDALHSGGVEKLAINQTLALNESGQKATLVVLRNTELAGHPFEDLIKKVPIVFLDDRLPKLLTLSFKFPFFSFFSLYHLTYPFFLPWVVNEKEFQALVSHGTYTSLTAIALKVFKRIPFYFSLWDPIAYILVKAYPTGPIHLLNFIIVPIGQAIDWLLLKKADGVFTAGVAHHQYLKKIGAKKITILYPGVFVMDKINPDKQDYILAVTAWKEGKNQDLIVDVLKHFSTMKVVMAGSWYPASLLKEFEKKIETLGLKKRLKITGPLPEESLQKLYANALFFMQVSDDRGFGMPALEAASCGCSFIIPEGQGVGELFTDSEDGFIVDLQNQKMFIDRINKFLGSKNLASNMGKNAWLKVRESYSWEKHAQFLKKAVLG